MTRFDSQAAVPDLLPRSPPLSLYLSVSSLSLSLCLSPFLFLLPSLFFFPSLSPVFLPSLAAPAHHPLPFPSSTVDPVTDSLIVELCWLSIALVTVVLLIITAKELLDLQKDLNRLHSGNLNNTHACLFRRPNTTEFSNADTCTTYTNPAPQQCRDIHGV